MVFVTIGTFEMEFKRLLESIEDADIEDEVVIQSGYTNFQSNKYKVVKFMEGREFEKYLKDAEVVICHGGVGSILNAIKNNKKIVAIPRLEKFNEHVDDHQCEIVKKFVKEGYILTCKDTTNIIDLINEAKKFIPKSYKSERTNLVSCIEQYLDQI